MEDSDSRNPGTRIRKIAASQDLEEKIMHLAQLDSTELRQSWRAFFRAAPPPNLGRGFMVRALAYRMQERALGGLKPWALRILDRASADQPSLDSPRTPTRRPPPGAVLIREWHGVTHRVTVLEHDVVYRGHSYKSLSEVARAITGTRWSGPMFFGLRNRKKEAANG